MIVAANDWDHRTEFLDDAFLELTPGLFGQTPPLVEFQGDRGELEAIGGVRIRGQFTLALSPGPQAAPLLHEWANQNVRIGDELKQIRELVAILLECSVNPVQLEFACRLGRGVGADAGRTGPVLPRSPP